MENKIQVLSDKRLIVGQLIGEFDIASLDSMGIEYRQKAYDLGYCLICDITKGKISASLIEALRAIKKYDRIKSRHLLKVPVAIVATGSKFVFFKVIEQFFYNANGNLKVFKDIDTAIEVLAYVEEKESSD